MRAAEIMTRPVVSVRPETTIREAVHLLIEHGFAGLPVVDDEERVIGVLTEADTLAASLYEDGISGTVADAMKRPVEVVTPETDTREIVRRILDGHLRCMPVVQHGELVGIISRRDLLRPMIRSDDAVTAGVARVLNEYTGHRSNWRVSTLAGAVTVSGRFNDEAERLVVSAIARTVPGVVSVELTDQAPAMVDH